MRVSLRIAGLLLCGAAGGGAQAAGLPDGCRSSLEAPEYHRGTVGDNSLEAYEERVAVLKGRGVYNPDLIPVLLDYGVLQQQNGEHRAAIRRFEEALLIMKVNHGLYHLAQLPVLDLMIQSRTALRHWKAVTDHYDKKHWLARRHYGNNDPAILPLLKQVREWHRGAYNKATGRPPEQHFRASEIMYARGIKIIRACGGTDRQAHCFWHRACCDDARPEEGVCPLDRGRWWR